MTTTHGRRARYRCSTELPAPHVDPATGQVPLLEVSPAPHVDPATGQVPLLEVSPCPFAATSHPGPWAADAGQSCWLGSRVSAASIRSCGSSKSSISPDR